MALNSQVGFYDPQGNPWCDDTGIRTEEPHPCTSCGELTHRTDIDFQVPLCNDGTYTSCTESLWREYVEALRNGPVADPEPF